jgi:hypothetical protein
MKESTNGWKIFVSDVSVGFVDCFFDVACLPLSVLDYGLCVVVGYGQRDVN